MNQRKLDLKRERIRALESELTRYKEAEENRRKDKGKERAIDQDNLNEQDAGISNNYMAPAATHAQPRRRQSTNKSNISIDDTSYMAQLPEEDLEESLFVTEIPDSEEGGGGSHEVVMLDDDGDDFADLDLVLSGTKPGRYSSTAAAGKLSRHPLKEWTNTGNVSNKRPASQAKESASSSVSFKDMNNKKRNLTSISSASEKWADMALFGTGIGSGGSSGKGNKSTRSGSKLQLATGEKKKARIRF